MIIGDIWSNLIVDFVVVVDVVVEMLMGYRWGQIVNRHGAHFVELDSCEIYTLAIELPNPKRPERQQ